jgi:hypothetical protein
MPDVASVWAKASVSGFQPMSGTFTRVVPAAAVNCGGMIICKSFRKLTT